MAALLPEIFGKIKYLDKNFSLGDMYVFKKSVNEMMLNSDTWDGLYALM
jgi:hypothetical protein